MKTNEYNVGEEFQVGLCRLKCIEQKKDINDKCTGCFFFPFDDCFEIAGNCVSNRREDKKEVIFVKIKEE